MQTLAKFGIHPGVKSWSWFGMKKYLISRYRVLLKDGDTSHQYRKNLTMSKSSSPVVGATMRWLDKVANRYLHQKDRKLLVQHHLSLCLLTFDISKVRV